MNRVLGKTLCCGRLLTTTCRQAVGAAGFLPSLSLVRKGQRFFPVEIKKESRRGYAVLEDYHSSLVHLEELPKHLVKNFPQVTTAEEAVKIIKSGDRVFVHSASGNPEHLLEAMCGRANELKNIEVCHLHIEGTAPHAKFPDVFRINTFFVGKNVRSQIKDGQADFVPIFLSDIDKLFEKEKGALPIDVALVTVSPPDRHGYCSLGTSVDISYPAVLEAKFVIAQVNKFMPRTHGRSLLHVSKIDKLVPFDIPLHESKAGPMSDTMTAIGENVASLIEDGSTLQMGIGSIPNATLACLKNHKDLGIHTEMFSEGVMNLVYHGVINNSKKKFFPGHIVSSFLVGSRTLYDFVDDNPLVQMLPASITNDPSIIRQNPKVVAINSAIEVDITGQVCSDSIGHGIYSGIGGQVDFERGAFLSEGGKPIIALSSRTSKGVSRIVPFIKEGGGVVTGRGHVNWIVTEYGSVNLFGKNLRQRAKDLISIAHPDDREELNEFYEKYYGKLW